jgi:hypothetical protein
MYETSDTIMKTQYPNSTVVIECGVSSEDRFSLGGVCQVRHIYPTFS